MDPHQGSLAATKIAKEAAAAGNPIQVGVLTSGGDAQGMNAAVRAVVRAGLTHGVQPWAIHEGWEGAVRGGNSITPIGWRDVSSILSQGGTVIGTARSAAFRTREGLKQAALNLVSLGIDRLIVIGGDGSLTGADMLRGQWGQLLDELVGEGKMDASTAKAHPILRVVGLVGSIDNDLVGSDMTIGADTALHRIVNAIDDLSSTAASHQRSFVVEVMGRHCGYLALMAAVAGGCDYHFIPECPPERGWEDDMCQKLTQGREAGRRESIVLVAEGAIDTDGNPITSDQVAAVLKERLGEDARTTILGHVQRGGSPSAYDRWMPTLLGVRAIEEVLVEPTTTESVILGVRRNRITRIVLATAVANTRAVAKAIEEKNFEQAVIARGASFARTLEIDRIMSTPLEGGGTCASVSVNGAGKRVAILHVGGLAAGMNTAARAAVRIGIDKGWQMLGVQGGVRGLLDQRINELSWQDVEGWVSRGGAELGTRREIPTTEQLYSVARVIEEHKIDAFLLIGGLNAYLLADLLVREADRYPAFRIPIMCVPASIDNNLPGTELSVGADTALNNAVWALDRIKQSASAAKRCFVAETMGRKCGYLTMMAGIASGAERIYLHEEGMELADLADEAARMRESFRGGRRLFLVVRSERASELYNTDFLARIFEEESSGLFDVRQSVLGHLQQGGEPTPFDRLLATRLVYSAMTLLEKEFAARTRGSFCVGMEGGLEDHLPVSQLMGELDLVNRRPKEQWWMELRSTIAQVSEEPLSK